jgi:hypothetical protein
MCVSMMGMEAAATSLCRPAIPAVPSKNARRFMRGILPPVNTSKTFRRASDLNNLFRAGWKAEPSSLTMLDEAPGSSHEKRTRDSIQS